MLDIRMSCQHSMHETTATDSSSSMDASSLAKSCHTATHPHSEKPCPPPTPSPSYESRPHPTLSSLLLRLPSSCTTTHNQVTSSSFMRRDARLDYRDILDASMFRNEKGQPFIKLGRLDSSESRKKHRW